MSVEEETAPLRRTASAAPTPCCRRQMNALSVEERPHLPSSQTRRKSKGWEMLSCRSSWLREQRLTFLPSILIEMMLKMHSSW